MTNVYQYPNWWRYLCYFQLHQISFQRNVSLGILTPFACEPRLRSPCSLLTVGYSFSQVDKVIGALPSFIKELSGRHVNLLFLSPEPRRPCWDRMYQMCGILLGSIDHIARKLFYRKWSVSWGMRALEGSVDTCRRGMYTDQGTLVP